MSARVELQILQVLLLDFWNVLIVELDFGISQALLVVNLTVARLAQVVQLVLEVLLVPELSVLRLKLQDFRAILHARLQFLQICLVLFPAHLSRRYP